jgi:thiol-disulfide isomerase/thioredoxin
MNPEIVSRILLAVTIIGGGLIVYGLFNRHNLVRNDGRISQFPSYKQGIPAILYFTTPTCAPCKTIQRPALKRLKDSLGERIQIIEIDASANEKMASTWGVLSVPTTYVFDEKGHSRFVNHGVVMADQLFQQLEIEDYSI